LIEFSSLARAYEELTAKIRKRAEYLDELINKSMESGQRLNAWTAEHIFAVDLTVLSGRQLIALLKTSIDMQEDVSGYGLALPILDYQDLSFVEGTLNKFLQTNVTAERVSEYYSRLTEPAHKSFAQDQEEDLLKLMAEFWKDGKLADDIRTRSIDEVKEIHGDFYSRLSQHAQEYAWVYYVYMGPAFTDVDYYGFASDYVKKSIDPQDRLSELRERRARITKLRAACLGELKPEGLNAFILDIASKVMWAKPRRKEYQSKSFYHMEKLAREIARRLFISVEQVRSAPVEVLEAALSTTRDVDWSIVNSIRNLHICLPNDDGSMTTLIDSEAEEFSSNSIKRVAESQDLTGVKELKGATACRGKAVGRAKIINVPADMEKMEYGDILVSSATGPSIVPAMKKAAAIITDIGGLTCHASIVSRELNIPCVVGLKVATKVVSDGDIVAVDADRAEIRKLTNVVSNSRTSSA